MLRWRRYGGDIYGGMVDGDSWPVAWVHRRGPGRWEVLGCDERQVHRLTFADAKQAAEAMLFGGEAESDG